MHASEVERKDLLHLATVAQAQMLDAQISNAAVPTSTARLRLSIAVERLHAIRRKLEELDLRKPGA